MRKTLPTALLLFFCVNVMAQESQTAPLPRTGLPSDFRFDHLDQIPRMAKRSINAQLQDRLGFMWFGTDEGLVRFDGYEEVLFRPDGAVSRSMSSGVVTSLMEDREGMLWVGTYSGLHRFDPTTERFTHFVHDENDPTSLSDNQVQVIVEDEAHSVWIATADGLNRFEPTSQGFSHYFDSLEERRMFSDDDVLALELAPSGGLWVGTGEGLYRFDPASGTSEIVFGGDANPDDALQRRHVVSALHVDRLGILWAATDGGLFTMSPSGSGLTLMDTEVNLLQRRSGFGFISEIAEDRDGSVWIGSESGLSRYDRATGLFEHFQQRDDDQASLSRNYVKSVVMDRQGSMWVGTLSGVNRFDPGHEGIRMHVRAEDALAEVGASHVVSIVEDDDRGLWFATRAGLYRRDPVSLRVEKVALDGEYDDRMIANLARPLPTMMLDRSGTLWHGWRKLHRWDRTSGKMVHVEPDPRSEYSSAAGFVTSLFEDKSGKVWVAYQSPGGFARYDPGSGRLVGYPLLMEDGISSWCRAWGLQFADGVNGAVWLSSRSGEFGRFDPDTETYTRQIEAAKCTSLGSDLFQDSKGMVWKLPKIGPNSLIRFDPTTSTSVEYHSDSTGWSALSDAATAIFEDSRGTLWLATKSGLSFLDRSSGAFTLVNDSGNILSGIWITAFVEGLDGALWLAGRRGDIARYDPDSGSIRLFGPDEGLVSNDRFTTGFATSMGEVFFRSGSEIVSFFPDRMYGQDDPPQVTLTGLRLMNESVVPGPDSPLERAMAFTDEIYLDHDKNNVTFEYAGLHYRNPSKNQYAVWLEDYEEAWRDIGTDRHAFYANLPPGSYVFRVKASTGTGTWSEEEASVRVVIRPPWWGSPWAYTFYVLLFAAGVFGVDRTQRRRLIKQERTRAARREAELRAEASEARVRALTEVDEMKSKFFANFSHELRTPLTLISGPLQRIRSGVLGPLPTELEVHLGMMLRNSQRLLRLVNQIMDVSRLEAGRVQLHPRTRDLVPFVRSMVALFSSSAEQKSIELSFESDIDKCLCSFDGEQMEKVLLNLLSNAIKFTRAEGSVKVRLRCKNEWAEIAVEDSGVGIGARHIPHLFDRFYRGDETQAETAEGTGIGLAIVNEVISLHGGTVTCTSERGVGSRFVVRFPVGDIDEREIEGPEDPAAHIISDASLLLKPLLPADSIEASNGALDGDEELPAEDVTTVLLVEDNPDLRIFLRNILSAQFRVLEAENGALGFAAARKTLPDLIISDVMMPEMDGFELSRALKADASTDSIPVILLTALAEETDVMTGIQTGVDAYVTKPFTPDLLMAQVKNLINLRHRLRERFKMAPAGVETVHEPATGPFERQVREIVLAHLSLSDLTVAQVAEHLAMSSFQLGSRLDKEIGVKPNAFIRTVRLEHAARMLDAKEGNVSEVAYATGFNSLGYFSKCFGEHFGVTPSAYLARGGSAS